MRMDADHRDEELPRCGKLVNVDVPIIEPWYCRINQVVYNPKAPNIQCRYIWYIYIYICVCTYIYIYIIISIIIISIIIITVLLLYIYIHTTYNSPLVFWQNYGSHGPSIDDWNDAFSPENGASP